jgi:hypothetical protein
MKKLGTPIGAGPGSESEKVGFEDFGTPLPVGRLSFGFLGLLGRCGFLPLAGVVVVVWVWVEPFCCLWRVGFGVVPEGVVEVELDDDEEEEDDDDEEECDPELEELEELELLLGGGLELFVVEAGGGGAGVGAQVSESTEAPAGSSTEEIGAPAAIGKVTVCPVTSLAVSVQLLADALGSAAPSQPASSMPASAIAKISFRLINNSARLLLPASCTSSSP